MSTSISKSKKIYREVSNSKSKLWGEMDLRYNEEKRDFWEIPRKDNDRSEALEKNIRACKRIYKQYTRINDREVLDKKRTINKLLDNI